VSERMYKKYFTKEQLQEMKASTVQDLRLQEDRTITALILFLVVGFIEVIMLIAMLFWTNKVTIFLVIVWLLFVGFWLLVFCMTLNDYKKLIDKTKERLNKL